MENYAAKKIHARHAICQAIYNGVEGAEWEILFCRFVEMNKEVNVHHPSGSSRARTFWKIRGAKVRGDANYDQTSEQRIVNREAVRQELWNKHLLNTALTLTEALRRVEEWD